MAFTGFLKIPDIDGESKTVGHEDEIDVWGVSWGLEQASASAGTRRLRRRTEVAPVVFHKFTDVSSPYLAQATAQAKSFPEIVLTIRKDSGDSHLDYLVITLKNAMIGSYQVQNIERDDADARLMERVQVTAEDIRFLYRQQTSGGSSIEHGVEIEVY